MMIPLPTALCLVLVLLTFTHKIVTSAKSNGLGDNINWVDYESAIADSSKPSMIILHKSWCPACKSLKSKLAESFQFEKLSARFSMVNANEDDPIHDLPSLNVDGTYIPRIFFIDQEGNVLQDIQNTKGNPNYKFYYYNENSIIDSMWKTLHKLEDASKDEL